MTLIAGVQASTSVLVQVANPAVRALALAGAAGLGLAAFRVRATSARLLTWTTVLYAALAMPLLGWMLPPVAIPVPEFLQDASLRYGAAQAVPSEVSTSQLRASTTAHVQSKVVVTRNATVKGIAMAAIGEHPASSAVSSETSKASPDGSAMVVANPAQSRSLLPSIRWNSMQWSAVAIAIYLSVALLLLVRLFVGVEFGRRLMRASRTIDDPALIQKISLRAHASGLALIPRVAESEFISVPVTMGALRSTILLPAGWQEWDDAKLDAVIAHEVSHVARRDGLTQGASLVHRAIFWFSPLAWWLDRQLADLAEQASDEAALSGGADRNDYARTLLGFFEVLQAAPGRVWWQGVAMAKAGQAERVAERLVERRLERILSWKGSVAMSIRKSSLKKSIAVAVVALAVPVVYLAASVRPTNYGAPVPQHVHFSQDQTPPAPRPAATPKAEQSATPEPAPASEMIPPPAPPAAAPVVIPDTIRGRIYGVPPAIAPVAAVPARFAAIARDIAPIAPRATMPPPAIWSGQASGSGKSHGGFSYHYSDDDEQRFVIVSGKTDSLTMSGSGADARHVEKLRKQIQGDFIWFQSDEKSYIIRDQATIDRARSFWAPEEELGKKQEALGVQQEALGKQQEELGQKMEEVQVNVPDLTAALDKLKAKLQKLGSHATLDQIGDLQSEIGDLQSKIGDIQSQAGDQQGKLGEEQGALGEKQGKLGEEQGKLGEQQGKMAEEATRQMKQLLDEAIKKGIAQPEL